MSTRQHLLFAAIFAVRLSNDVLEYRSEYLMAGEYFGMCTINETFGKGVKNWVVLDGAPRY